MDRMANNGTRYRPEASSTPVRYTGINVTLYGRGEAVAMNYAASTSTKGGAAYLGKDILGSIRSVSNSQANLEDRYEYDAFGKPYKGDLSNGMNLGYTGKPYDAATGMYDYGYRDYKPENARFTTVDPIRDGANWFAYVNNDPVNYFDPFGLNPFSTLGKAISDTVSSAGKTVANAAANAGMTIANAVQGMKGDVFVTVEIDLVAGFGFEASISLVVDLDHPLESGLNVSGGPASGANVGIGVGAGYVKGDIEGAMPLGVDVNLGPVPLSVSVITDDKGIIGGSVTYGLGGGLSVSSQNSVTLSPQSMIDAFSKSDSAKGK